MHHSSTTGGFMRPTDDEKLRVKIKNRAYPNCSRVQRPIYFSTQSAVDSITFYWFYWRRVYCFPIHGTRSYITCAINKLLSEFHFWKSVNASGAVKIDMHTLLIPNAF
jgi:hypothetical protein